MGSDDSLAANDFCWLSIRHPDGTRDHVRLTLALTTVGRSEQNVVDLLDPKLSRFHCEIERRAEGYRIRDCNSRNGTLVNGKLSEAGQLLSDADRIELGHTVMTFHSQRPPELRSDPALEMMVRKEEETGEIDVSEIITSRRRPTGRSYDARLTRAVDSLSARHEDPWKFLIETSNQIMDATNRGGLIELVVERTRHFFQAQGVLLALGRSPGNLIVSADLGLSEEDQKRCLDFARRVFTAREAVGEERWFLGVPIHSRKGLQGALVLFDLAGAVATGSKELLAVQTLADMVGCTLTSSLLLEEVRREERGAGARRIAQDLRSLLRPLGKPELSGLEIGLASTRGEEIGSDCWDYVLAPVRAGRTELYFALGDVPAPDTEPLRRLRRSGERSFVSLVGQAELRGALRAMVEVTPRTSDLLGQLDAALRRDATVERISLMLARYDPAARQLRFAASGPGAALIRRGEGEVETFPGGETPLGGGMGISVSEREVDWESGDQVLFVTAGALACPEGQGESLETLFKRLGGEGSAAEVAHRLSEAIHSQIPQAEHRGYTVLVLRHA